MLDALLDAVHPPASPRNAVGGKVWQNIQASLGIELPDEWRRLGEAYGSGTFRRADGGYSYIWIYNPLAPNFTKRISQVCDQQRETQQVHDTVFELHSFYPAAVGYFPIGEDDCENSFWFHMLGPPPQWPIVVWGGFNSERVQTFPLTLTEFLYQFFTGEIPIPGYEGSVVDRLVFRSDKTP